ncbi:MAG: M1 family metallopeptidase [Bacteroidota bacterium]
MKKLIFFLFIIVSLSLSAQKHNHTHYFSKYKFTEADTIRGMLRPERTNFDVTFYNLDIKVDVENRFLSGFVDVHFEAVEDIDRLQLDLYKNMKVKSVEWYGKTIPHERIHDAFFVDFPSMIAKGKSSQVRVHYEGKPTIAQNAPWDGGFVWDKDRNGNPWVGVACEGDGASMWWPCKDHLTDEPDSMSIKIAVPDDLVCAANGELRQKKTMPDGYTRYDWFVSYPINSYNVSVNIADYANFKETYTAEDGDTLELDYYVLSYNLEKAKKHFKQTHKVLACFEKYFGKYPFWEDGFGMVETPYLGMEHQGAIAYGNKYMRGYLGGLVPPDMKWDYIIVHETGHEYFGNSISAGDIAEVWIHESFTTYMEALYVECTTTYEDAVRYLQSQRGFIRNQEPIVGPLNVNFEGWGGSDQYYKGSWMLHTLRHAIADDEMWFDLLRSFYNRYAISVVKTEDFVNFVNQCTKRDYSPFFEQYLFHPSIPVLEYRLKQKGKKLQVEYRWQTDVEALDMPILVGTKNAYTRIEPTSEWKKTTLPKTNEADFKVATELFYVDTKRLD